MSVSNLNQNSIFTNTPKSRVNFGAGWSAKIEREIINCKIPDIADTFEKQGIETDFKDNKVIAWCSLKTLEIFNELNQKYKLNLKLPKAVYVEDFSKLHEQNPEEYGICNWYPGYLKKDSDKIYPERTVIFNSFNDDKYEHNWANIDSIAENLYQNRIMSTPHFLSTPIHEFSHAVQNGYLFDRFNEEDFLKRVRTLINPQNCNLFKQKYGGFLTSISTKAEQKPLEAVADDMTQKISKALSFDTLHFGYNPFIFSSYPKNSIVGKLLSFKKSDNILSRIWNGEFP